MPPHFSSTYTPIAAAGTKGQIRHVARLMATQFTAVNLGPGVKLAKRSVRSTIEEEDEEMPYTKGSILASAGGGKLCLFIDFFKLFDGRNDLPLICIL